MKTMKMAACLLWSPIQRDAMATCRQLVAGLSVSTDIHVLSVFVDSINRIWVAYGCSDLDPASMTLQQGSECSGLFRDRAPQKPENITQALHF